MYKLKPSPLVTKVTLPRYGPPIQSIGQNSLNFALGATFSSKLPNKSSGGDYLPRGE